jgi:molecular chaperone GrpE
MNDYPIDHTEEMEDQDLDELELEDEHDLPVAEDEQQERIFQLTKLLEETRDQYLRTYAEFQTFRRRTADEREQFRLVAMEGLIADILPVLDNFDRTLTAAESGATIESLMEGIRMIDRQLLGVLENRGLKRVSAKGQPFDEQVHEALGVDSVEGVESGTITAEVEAGYKLGNKVIRPARVRVAQ